MKLVDHKHILITGGTGSLGQRVLRRLLSGEVGTPRKITVFSRDEAKQHALRLEYLHQRPAVTDEVIYENFSRMLEFRIGDVRDFGSVAAALRPADIVIHAAALKQVPTCEYFPSEAVATNVGGPENIVRAIRDLGLDVETVVGVSTDKAVKPVNVMGMTKALQERIFVSANLESKTRFVLVRYGNVLASRGSVIPLFLDQIRIGGPVTITDRRMTRFLVSVDEAVDAVFAALASGHPGETFVPRAPAARIADVAAALIGDREIPVRVTAIRPGEKIHESLITLEEGVRTVSRSGYYVVAPILPELHRPEVMAEPLLDAEYSSENGLLAPAAVLALLRAHGFVPPVAAAASGGSHA